MIRIVARGLAAVLLEVATMAAIMVITLVALSAHLTARFVGVDTKLSRRTAIAMRLTRDLMALAQRAQNQEESDAVE